MHSTYRCAMLMAFVPALFLASNASAGHPLDPLSWQEYWTVLEVLRDADHLDGKTRFSMINLKEPPKDFVWNWSQGEDTPRTAFAVVRQEKKSYRAEIDLIARRLSSWTELEGVQPSWLGEEFSMMREEVTSHPEVIEALRLRGIEDMTFLDMSVVPLGYFGAPEEKGRRIGHVNFSDVRDVRNIWHRGIQGLTIVVDVETKEVLRVVDEGVVLATPTEADFDLSAVGPSREVPGPIHVEQPLGPGFTLDGYQVEWQKWRFHVRPDQRVGMIISTVTYEVDGEERPILYQGFMSEMFVPYMDPATPWYARNFIDAGEFSVGGMAKPMVKGQDSPDHAVYLDSLIAGDNGRPSNVPRTISIFERENGDMSWRHWETAAAGGPQSRVKRDLVVRCIGVVGNYDYVFDWIFQQDGSIRIAAGATGIVESKMVRAARAQEEDGESGSATPAPDAYGRFVDRHIVAVNHDHYFSFRLDLDVDGPENSFMIDRLVPKTLPDDHPRRSIWVSEPELARNESDAQLNIDLNRPALWRVISQSRSNRSGYPTSYQLMPGRNTGTLLSPDDYPRQRAGFIDHHLWVTPYKADELYAAGEYPTLSEAGYGLPSWTSENRAIENTDIVLWYTVGMHHMPRAEDWPVMPVLWHEFELRPFDFFNGNPALDLPN